MKGPPDEVKQYLRILQFIGERRSTTAREASIALKLDYTFVSGFLGKHATLVEKRTTFHLTSTGREMIGEVNEIG